MAKKFAVASRNLPGEVWFVNFPTVIIVYLTLQKAHDQTSVSSKPTYLDHVNETHSEKDAKKESVQ